MTSKNTNMTLWDSVCKTAPEYTKTVDQRGGFTSICAMSQIQEATRKFGPAGKGWGWSYEFIFPPNNTIIANVTLWHGNKDQTVCQSGQKKLEGKYGPDEDAAKKAVTDGLTKCLSYLGFNADVFLGKFDDNKYVAEREQESAEAKPDFKPPEVWAAEFVAQIGRMSSMDALIKLWQSNGDAIKALSADIRAEVNAAKDNKKAFLENPIGA